MKQYKAVFIDWDDTIGDFLGAAKLALQDMYEKYNLSEYFASFEEFFLLYKPHNIELWDKYGKDLVTKEYLSFDRFFFPLMHGSKVSPRIQSYTTLHNPTLQISMGMSDDYLVAIEEGSTMVRIGSTIFGSRGSTPENNRIPESRIPNQKK